MDFLKELIAKQRYPVLMLIGGIALLILANYSFSQDEKTRSLKREHPIVTLDVIGVFCVLGSAALFLIDEDTVAFMSGCRVKKTETGFTTSFRDSELQISFGLLQDICRGEEQDTLIVLPVNEFFDRRCFDDERTSAGAFIRCHFSNKDAIALRELVDLELGNRPSQCIETKPGEKKNSYSVGTCLYLDRPASNPYRIVLASVATDRHPHGLRTELATIFRVVEEIRCILANEHLSSVCMPLFGAGKGGVPPEVAYLSLLSALLDTRSRDGGHHLKKIRIVIYQPAGQDPQVMRKRAKRDLRHLVSLFQES